MDPLSWLWNNPSVEEATAFIKNHSDALMGKDSKYVPLHEAISCRDRGVPDEVILLLLEACPQAAAAKDRDACWLPQARLNALHLALSQKHVMCSEKVFKALLNAHPGAASERDPYTKNLPLHNAVKNTDASEGILLLLLNAYPRAAFEETKEGRLLVEICLERNASDEDKYQPEEISLGSKESSKFEEYDEQFEEYDDNSISSHVASESSSEESDSGHSVYSEFEDGGSKSSEDSPDFFREICKVRIDGLLLLGFVLTKRSSDDIVLAVLEAYPEAAGKRFSTNFDECILPLHIAYEDNNSELVKDALHHAYPDAEKNNPFETTYLLHKLLENKLFDQRDEDDVEDLGDDVVDLIKNDPEALGKRGRDGRLPLHIAIDRIVPGEITYELFEAFRQAGKEKMKDGRLPIEVIVEQKVTDGWPQTWLTLMATRLLKNDMPVSIEDGTPVEHCGNWHACISYSTETAACAVRNVLLDSEKWSDGIDDFGCGFGKHIHDLADARDAKGRLALGLAAEGPREVIYEYLLFCGQYKLHIGPPEHRTATSVVLRAQDLRDQADYGVTFDKADKDGNGKLDRKELEAIASSIGLDPDLFLKVSKESDESISKGEFVSICKRQLGDGPREVVIKLMQNKDQWERECNARKKYELNPNYVVSALLNVPSEDAIANAVRNGEGGLDIITKKHLNGIEVGEHAFVMEAGDRNLLQMFYQEQPKLDDVRVILREVFEAVEHLHKEKLMHGDIKMLNIVRFRIDSKLRIIDLDASAGIMSEGEEDEKKTFAGAKFSSAILPPEMIEMIDTNEKLEEFKKYWESENDEDLKEKVAPKIFKIAKAYVVKSFRTEEGRPVKEGLPYELVRASENIDVWSLGVLAFTLLTGEALIPSNRDDDCASGAAMHLLKSWETRSDVLIDRFKKVQNDAARDLVWKLLKPKPEERPTVASLLEQHPFFNPKMSANTEDQFRDMKESLQNVTKQMEILNANILEVKKLSIDSKEELFHTRHVLHRTRHVLLKGIFEATEVYTPTTFIILNNKLPPAAQPSGEQVEKNFGIDAAEDGSGVSVTTKHASLAVSAEGLDINLKGDLKEHYEQVQDGIKWAKRIKTIGTNFAAGDIDNAFKTIKEGISDLIVEKTIYLYLIDELTGKPVEAKGWPLIITTPSDVVPRLIPLMQVGMIAISLCNGAAGLAKVFGIPAPEVPKEWSKGAQDSVELLKQESSVEEFGIVHAQVKGGTQENTSVRGASLREFQDFMKTNDPGLKEGKNGHFAGLHRIGDPEEGTAVWTALTDQSAIENALKERTKQREEEEERKQNLNRRQEEMAGEERRLIEATTSAAANGHIQETVKKEKESEGFGRGEILEEDGRLPVGTTASSNERNRSIAKGTEVTADEINVSNDLRNLVVDSEEIAKLIKAAATAAAEEATAAAKDIATTAAKEAVSAAAQEIATAAAKEAVSAAAKEAVSAAALSEKDCWRCAIM